MTSKQKSTTSSDVPELLSDHFPVGKELPPVTVLVTPDRIDAFGYISTDHNPVHFDEEFASKTMFGKRIAHGMLSASFISAIFGNIEGAIYLKQSLEFLKPVFIGDTITATAYVQGYGQKPGTVDFFTVCKNGEEKVVIRGEALIWFPSLTSK